MLRSLPLLLALLAVGCADPDPADPASVTPATPEAATPPPTAAPQGSDTWALGHRGAGPLRFGMPLSELRSHVQNPPDSATAASCTIVTLTEAPDSMMAMVDGNRLVRLDVIGGDTPTTAGVRIGDTEAAVRTAYPNVRERVHKYVAEQRYLIAIPDAPADTLHRILFETDGERVLRYRAGSFPAVEYVEVCG